MKTTYIWYKNKIWFKYGRSTTTWYNNVFILHFFFLTSICKTPAQSHTHTHTKSNFNWFLSKVHTRTKITPNHYYQPYQLWISLSLEYVLKIVYICTKNNKGTYHQQFLRSVIDLFTTIFIAHVFKPVKM